MGDLIAGIKFLLQLKDLIEKLGKMAQDAQFKAWVSDLEGTINAAESAKTTSDRVAAARSLVSLIRRL